MSSILPAITLVASTALGDMPMSEIEHVYWDCDYKGTHQILSFDDAHVCSAVFERLKSDKFNSEFGRFLEWWRANRSREYALRADRSGSPRAD